ncbi:hypothetical protein M514_09607 [Trichuris suis]|uniref:Uncharacterized protein n=1 Tax=Trichuris suis TaxID=68888 RepID=A0A085N875_9BILA|nr:hypothetical protein M514_09607 [Trichuris suis]
MVLRVDLRGCDTIAYHCQRSANDVTSSTAPLLMRRPTLQAEISFLSEYVYSCDVYIRYSRRQYRSEISLSELYLRKGLSVSYEEMVLFVKKHTLKPM